MSDIADFASDLARKVQEKQEADRLIDVAQLRRAEVSKVKVSDMWSQFSALIKEGIGSFNSRSSKLAVVSRDLVGEIRIEFDGHLIFIGKLDEGTATRVTFARTDPSVGKPPMDWYTVSINPREELTIANPKGFAVSGPEELAKQALSFMFAPFTI